MYIYAFTLLLLLNSANSFVQTPRHMLKEKTLETVVDSTVAWGMESIFTPKEIDNYQITSYRLEGDTPCTTQDPSLLLMHLSTHRDSSFILDFAIVNTYLYYLTSSHVYRMDLSKSMYKDVQDVTEVLNVSTSKFDYIDAFNFSNNDTVLLLKSAGPKFSYAVLPQSNGKTSTLETIENSFDKFTYEMKVITCEDYVFIPAGTQGIFVYKYDTSSKRLFLKTVLNFTQDARDVTVRPYASSTDLLLIAADYNKGIILSRLNADSMNVTHSEVIAEFIKAKSVSWVTKGTLNKLLIVLDALGNSSKFIILSFELKVGENINFAYDQIKLLDGIAQYGDANNQYAAILMPNSIMVTGIGDRNTNMIGYINNHGVNHIKLYSPNKSSSGVWLLYTRGVEIVNTYIMGTKGFLMCDTGNKAKTHSFSILGQSQLCGKDANNFTIRECYYQTNVSLHVAKTSYKESLEGIKVIGLVVGIAIFMLMVILVVALVIVGLRYQSARRTLAEYQTLRSAREVPQVSVPTEPKEEVNVDSSNKQ